MIVWRGNKAALTNRSYIYSERQGFHQIALLHILPSVLYHLRGLYLSIPVHVDYFSTHRVGPNGTRQI